MLLKNNKFLLTLILICVLFLVEGKASADLKVPNLSSSINADSNSNSNVSERVLWWRTPLYMAINQYLSVALHEGSHALTAKLMGYDIESVKIGFRYGEVRIKDAENMSTFQNVTLSLTGPFSNRFVAMAINSYLDANEENMDENVRSFLGTAYIWNRGNFAWYLFKSAAGLVLPGDSYSDWSDASYYMANGDITLTYVIMGGFVAFEIWDLYNSREEIERNYNRMLGRNVTSSAASGASI